jgi:Tol biopolymer transport system component
MRKLSISLKCIIYILYVFLLMSCATSNVTTAVRTELRNWRAESENVVNLSLLLEDDGNEGCPVLLNENTLIFESKKNDNYDLWTIDPNKKGGIVQLTTYNGDDRVPCVHPDGKKYVFLSDRGATGYYVGEIGKSTVISLLDASRPYIDDWSSGDISPDGSTFIYVSGKFIWSYDFNTRIKTQLIQGTEPKWAPDGKKIIFRKIGKELGNTLVSTSIWLMNADGSEQTEIIPGDNKFSYKGARISPNGQKILYEKLKILSTRHSTRKDRKGGITTATTVTYLMPDIWVCNIDGNDHIQITTNPLSDVAGTWINNKTIVFCSDRPQSGKYEDRKWDLWLAKFSF